MSSFIKLYTHPSLPYPVSIIFLKFPSFLSHTSKNNTRLITTRTRTKKNTYTPMTQNRVGVGLKTVWSRFSGSLQAQKASPWIDTLQQFLKTREEPSSVSLWLCPEQPKYRAYAIWHQLSLTVQTLLCTSTEFLFNTCKLVRRCDRGIKGWVKVDVFMGSQKQRDGSHQTAPKSWPFSWNWPSIWQSGICPGHRGHVKVPSPSRHWTRRDEK